jgi:hypothetical protein
MTTKMAARSKISLSKGDFIDEAVTAKRPNETIVEESA